MCVIYQKPLLLLCLWLFCALFVPFSRQIFNEVLLVFLLFFWKNIFAVFIEFNGDVCQNWVNLLFGKIFCYRWFVITLGYNVTFLAHELFVEIARNLILCSGIVGLFLLAAANGLHVFQARKLTNIRRNPVVLRCKNLQSWYLLTATLKNTLHSSALLPGKGLTSY